MTESDKKFFIIAGIFLMLIAVATVIFLDGMSGQQWFGTALLFLIGLGMCVAGSPDPRDKERKH